MCMKYASASIIGKREYYAILCDARCIKVEQYAREERWWTMSQIHVYVHGEQCLFGHNQSKS